MIKTLQTKLRLSSLKSDCQFHSYQRDGKSGLHSGKREEIYEPGVGFDWAMIIPSKMIIVRHSSDPVHDRISHFLLSSALRLWVSANSQAAAKHLHAQARSDMSPQRVQHGGGKETLLQSRPVCYLRHITIQAKRVQSYSNFTSQSEFFHYTKHKVSCPKWIHSNYLEVDINHGS